MSVEERKNKRARRRRFRLILVTVVIVYLIFRMIPTLYASNLKTITVEHGYIEISVKTDGIILRDEKVYKINGTGKVVYLADEGKKLGKGMKVAQIIRNSKNYDLEKEIEEIENRIKTLQENNISTEIFSEDLEKNENYIEDITEKIKQKVILGQYEEINNLKEELELRMNKQAYISGEKGYLGESLNQLKNRKEELIKQLDASKEIYYSDKTGILSYKIDGLEEIFSSSNISNLTVEDYKIIEKRQVNLRNNEAIKHGDPIFKICDNYYWYIMVKIDNECLDSLEEGNDVYIRIGKEDKEYKANIYKINKGEQESLIIFRLDDYLYKFIDDRYVNIDIIKKKYEGMKIPKTSIVEENGIKGVFIKDENGIVKFRPIKILGEDDEYVIIYEGDKINPGNRGKIEVNVNSKMEKMYTINLFDNVIVHGDKVREGQIIY